MRSDREIDDAIDRAVRDIMSTEPPAGLRGRVLGRLEDPASFTASGKTSSWFTLPRFAAGMALLAVAIATVSLLRSDRAAAPAGTPVVAQNQPAPPAPSDVRPVDPAPVPVPAPAAEPTTPPAPRRGDPQVKFPARGVVAATSVAPDATTPAGQPDPAGAAASADVLILTPVPLVIAPLIVQPIVIPPIRPPR
jgi:hypothetical protein